MISSLEIVPKMIETVKNWSNKSGGYRCSCDCVGISVCLIRTFVSNFDNKSRDVTEQFSSSLHLHLSYSVKEVVLRVIEVEFNKHDFSKFIQDFLYSKYIRLLADDRPGQFPMTLFKICHCIWEITRLILSSKWSILLGLLTYLDRKEWC